MAPEQPEIRRIRLDAHTSVWVPATAPDPGVMALGANALAPSAPASYSIHPAAFVVAAVLAVAALLRLGMSPEGLLAAAVLAVLSVLSAIDLRVRLLPNRIVFPAMAMVLAWQTVFFTGRLVESTIAALGGGALLLLPSVVQPGAVGMGDVKLATLLGAALGKGVLAALMIGSFASVPFAVVMLVRGARKRRAALPFGPFLAFGAAVVLLA